MLLSGSVCVGWTLFSLLALASVQNGPQSLVPLAGAVYGLLEVVVHSGGVACAVQLHHTALEPILSAALAEACVAVYVEVKDGGRRTLPIAGEHGHLGRGDGER